MSSPESPCIEVVLALKDRQHVARLPLQSGMTALDAVRAAGFLELLPGQGRAAPVLGIYGKRVDGAHLLRDGDRVEIYRPLESDPREARRRAAQAALQERRQARRDRRGR
jgi:hypothetical protein